MMIAIIIRVTGQDGSYMAEFLNKKGYLIQRDENITEGIEVWWKTFNNNVFSDTKNVMFYMGTKCRKFIRNNY